MTQNEKVKIVRRKSNPDEYEKITSNFVPCGLTSSEDLSIEKYISPQIAADVPLRRSRFRCSLIHCSIEASLSEM